MENSPIDKILRGGRGMLLAYDHGFEHGPQDFDERSVDPSWIMQITETGHFTGVVFQKGVAAKYYDKNIHKTPLVIKMNGKTAFHKDEEPLSLSNCTIEEAVDLGASAIGYTIYVGSEHEQKMLDEFAQIEKEAHEKGLAVIGWMYPRGKRVEDDTSKDTLAYAARLGLELNADAVKIKYTGDKESFKWVVKSAGKTKVFVVGGEFSSSENEILDTTRDILEAGACGWAIGRNIWQSENPQKISSKIAEILYE